MELENIVETDVMDRIGKMQRGRRTQLRCGNDLRQLGAAHWGHCRRSRGGGSAPGRSPVAAEIEAADWMKSLKLSLGDEGAFVGLSRGVLMVRGRVIIIPGNSMHVCLSTGIRKACFSRKEPLVELHFSQAFYFSGL